MIHNVTISFKILFNLASSIFMSQTHKNLLFCDILLEKFIGIFKLFSFCISHHLLTPAANFFLWNIFIFSSVHLRFLMYFPLQVACVFGSILSSSRPLILVVLKGFVLKHLLISCYANNLREIIHLKLEKFKICVFELNHWHSHAILNSPNILWACIFLWSLKLSGN